MNDHANAWTYDPNRCSLLRSDWPTEKEFKALFQFTSDDETRPHICHIAMNGGFIWATDGHCAARIKVGIDNSLPARMMSKDGVAWHTEDDLNLIHPPCSQVWPKQSKGTYKGPWSLSPIYIARLVDVEKALTTRRREEFKATTKLKGPALRNAISVINECNLMQLDGEMDPAVFELDYGRWSVIIMPRRRF
jgi:hypothetical protein